MRVTLSALFSIVVLSVAGCVLPTTTDQAEPTVLDSGPASTPPAEPAPDEPVRGGSGADDGADETTLADGSVTTSAANAETDAAGKTDVAGKTDADDSARAISATSTDEIPAADWDAIVDLFDRELLAIRTCLSEMPNCDTSVFREFGTDDYFEFMDESYADSWDDTYVEDIDQFNRRVSFEGQDGDVIEVRVCETDATLYTDADGEVLTDDFYSWSGIYSVEQSDGDWIISYITTLDEGYSRGDNVCMIT